jgi:hypothetical protein
MRTQDYKRAALAVLGAIIFNLFFPLPPATRIIDAVRAPVLASATK